LNSIPFSQITNTNPVDVECVMDASKYGSCAADLTNMNVFTHVHSEADRLLFEDIAGNSIDALGINVLEASSALHAALLWAPLWSQATRQVHVRFHLDNNAAISWINKRYSPNSRGQNIVRVLALIEVLYNLRFTATFIPGTDNILADAGSRLDNSVNYRLFQQLTNEFQVHALPKELGSVSTLWSRIFKTKHGLAAHAENILDIGINGQLGARVQPTVHNYPAIPITIPSNSPNTPHISGVMALINLIMATQLALSWEKSPPYDRSTANSISKSRNYLHSSSSSKASNACPNQSLSDYLSTWKYYAGLAPELTGSTSSNAVIGAQLSSPTFSCSVGPKLSSPVGQQDIGLCYEDAISNSGMRTRSNAVQQKPKVFQFFSEEQKTTNTQKEQNDSCKSQETTQSVLSWPQECYVQNMTQDSTLKKGQSHLDPVQKSNHEQQHCGLKQQPKVVDATQKDSLSIQSELAAHQRYSMQEKIHYGLNYWEDGSLIVSNNIPGWDNTQQMEWPQKWFSTSVGQVVFNGALPTTRPHPGFCAGFKYNPFLPQISNMKSAIVQIEEACDDVSEIAVSLEKESKLPDKDQMDTNCGSF
jgi:hypothetical protein